MSSPALIFHSCTCGTAIVAGMLRAEVYCPGCRTYRNLDLRTLDRHPLASVGSLVVGLRCSWCRGSTPMPKIMGLRAAPMAGSTTGAGAG